MKMQRNRRRPVTLAVLGLAAAMIASSHDRVHASEGAVAAKTQFVESKGRTIAYRSVGTGAPIVLCNRFRGVLDSWDPAFIDALARHFRLARRTEGHPIAHPGRLR